MIKVKVTKPPKRIQKDLTGKKFGRLTVIGFNRIQKGSYRWACECECGNVVSVPYSRLMRGETKSCGCILRELKTKHGKSNTRLYTAWENMKTRCYNPNDDFYADYGGRGIKVCDEWLDDFTSFYKWSMENGYKSHLTIDRIDNNGDYSPDNCRWVDLKTQGRNKRNNVQVTINGETKTLSEWAESEGINQKTLFTRYYRGDRGKRLIRKVSRR